METCDVAVIGAGIVGAACAYELALSGLRVAVVEPNAVAAGGTNLGYGSLSILDEGPGQFALTRYGMQLWDQMSEWLPRECEYHRCGTILVALDEGQLKESIQRAEFFNRRGVHTEVLNRQQLSEAEPGLRPDAAGGLYVADDGYLRASRTAEFLFQLALQKGAQLIQEKAAAIDEHEVKLAGGTVLYAGTIVNATGNDAAKLTPELPIKFSKGHVLVVETPTECVRHHVSEMATHSANADETVRFEARQNEDGEVWVGSSHQITPVTAGTQAEPRIVALMLRRAIEMLPAIGHAKPVRSWTGLRALTDDGLPLIGRVAGKESIFVATGHNSYGATTALATAKLIADEILLRTPEIDPAPYWANRFHRTNS